MYDFKNVNILLVESSEEVSSLIRSVLSMLSVPGQNIDTAYNVDEAFSQYVRTSHDIVITDWLDNMDQGLKLVKLIRTSNHSPYKFVPIIMSAGSGHLSRVVKSRDTGVSEYLVKPFAAKELAKRLARVIEHPKPFVVSDHYVGHDRRTKKLPFQGEDRRKQQNKMTYE